MNLLDKDATLFFDLMWGLQYFVNQKHKINPDFKSLEEYVDCSMEEKIEVRNALYSDIKIIDSYIKENPYNLPATSLDIISGWKRFVQGNFYIERVLKRFAVFIEDDDVYAVQGLHQGFDELIPRSRLPLYVRTILLPFKGKIIYDGVFHTQNIYFGGGVKRRLKETYMIAKQNNRIIDSLDSSPKEGQKKEASKKPPNKDWKPELEAMAKASRKLRGKATDPALFSPSFSLVKASIEFTQLAVSDTSDPDDLSKALNKVRRAYNKTSTVLDRHEY